MIVRKDFFHRCIISCYAEVTANTQKSKLELVNYNTTWYCCIALATKGYNAKKYRVNFINLKL